MASDYIRHFPQITSPDGIKSALATWREDPICSRIFIMVYHEPRHIIFISDKSICMHATARCRKFTIQMIDENSSIRQLSIDQTSQRRTPFGSLAKITHSPTGVFMIHDVSLPGLSACRFCISSGRTRSIVVCSTGRILKSSCTAVRSESMNSFTLKPISLSSW